jgi:hypothetical protein
LKGDFSQAALEVERVPVERGGKAHRRIFRWRRRWNVPWKRGRWSRRESEPGPLVRLHNTVLRFFRRWRFDMQGRMWGEDGRQGQEGSGRGMELGSAPFRVAEVEGGFELLGESEPMTICLWNVSTWRVW